MSIRAYKILKKVVEKNPSFNLWHDNNLLAFFSDQKNENEMDIGAFEEQLGEDGSGTIWVMVGAIKKALKNPDLWEPEDYRIKQLRKDIRGLEDYDLIEYECY